MITILGLLLFFGITATIQWLFLDVLWRSHNIDGYESRVDSRTLDGGRRTENDQLQSEKSPTSA